MARQRTKITWVSDDGKEYKTEIEAIRADAKFWKKQYEDYGRAVPYDDERIKSSYGSSGGGGHD
jgi:hypothetical protein